MISRAAAAAEILRRDMARESLAHYAVSVDVPSVPLLEMPDDEAVVLPSMRIKRLPAHHALIYNSIQDCTDRSLATLMAGSALAPINLMLLLPPGSAKSTCADVVSVPWFMSRRPKGLGGVILASYAGDISKKQGRKARQVVGSRSHTSIFPEATLRGNQSAADEWALTNDAEFMAGGLLSGLTGNRASLGILDDPISGREAAESEGQRNKTWDAYTDDFCSRLLPGAPQILIQTRWHQSDIAGRILPERWSGESGIIDGRDGRTWRVICLPAICERQDDPLGRAIGDTLWPDWFSLAHWEPFKKNRRTWASLYQQQPSPPEGTIFQRAWFEGSRYEVRPVHLHLYMSSDHALTQDDGDFTVLRIWGVDTSGDLYWVGGWRGQTTVDKWADQAVRLIKQFKPMCWFVENDTIWKSAAPLVRRVMLEQEAACRIEPMSTAGDKEEKSQSFQGMASMGRVHLPRSPDADAAIDEYLLFPGGKNDDEVDAGSTMGRALMDAHPAIVQTKPPAARTDMWGKKVAQPTDWRVA